MVDLQFTRSIAILREEKNKWERRCSITPNEVKEVLGVFVVLIVLFLFKIARGFWE
jgi:hypothetical protein